MPRWILAVVGFARRKDTGSTRLVALGVLIYGLFLFAPLTIVGITAATILLFVVALYHCWREPEPSRLPGWLLAAFVLLPAAGILSALANPEPLTNLAQLRKEYAFFLPLALLPALSTVDRRKLFVVYGTTVALAGLYGIIQHYWGVDWFRTSGEKLITPAREAGSEVFHAKGTFSHHLTFAGFMLINVPFFSALAVAERGRWRWFFGMVALMALLGTLYSMGRSGWLGAAAGMGALLLGFPRRTWLPAVLAVLMVGATAVPFYTDGLQDWVPGRTEDLPGLVQRLVTTSPGKDSERLYIWKAAWLGIREHPILGVGYRNDKLHSPAYRREVSRRDRYRFTTGSTVHAHNVYLQVAYELGVVGLLAYLYLWGAVIWWASTWVRRAGAEARFERAVMTGSACGLLGSMVAGVFENNFFDAEVRTCILIMMGLIIHAGLQVRRRAGVSDDKARAACPEPV